MATRFDIQQEAGQGLDTIRRRYLKRLADYTKRPTILYASAAGTSKYANMGGPHFSVTQEDMQGFMASCAGLKGDKLDLILHSPGGSLETAEQVVNYLRAKYTHIRAIIPQNAMSAATMIACACDEIVMGKHSALGPIDPQITIGRPQGAVTLPAAAFLDEFEQAKREIAATPASAAVWIDKLRELPPGFLSRCQVAQELSELRVKEWLTNFMGLSQADAASAAAWLADAKEHKSHGRPLSADMLRAKKIKVTNMEDDQNLQDRILSVFHASMVTFEMTACGKIIEGSHGKGYYLQIKNGR